jgi:hypothetical protein
MDSEQTQPAHDDETRRRNEDAFDDFVDQVTGPGSQWSYDEGVHVASNLYDQAGYGSPYPNDYVPRDRRRIATGGA